MAKKCTTLQSFVEQITLLVHELSVYVKSRYWGCSEYVKLIEQLTREYLTLMQSLVKQITKLVHELRWILHDQGARYSWYLKQ